MSDAHLARSLRHITGVRTSRSTHVIEPKKRHKARVGGPLKRRHPPWEGSEPRQRENQRREPSGSTRRIGYYCTHPTRQQRVAMPPVSPQRNDGLVTVGGSGQRLGQWVDEEAFQSCQHASHAHARAFRAEGSIHDECLSRETTPCGTTSPYFSMPMSLERLNCRRLQTMPASDCLFLRLTCVIFSPLPSHVSRSS